MPSQLFNRIADAARAELAEVCEVFAYLRRVHVELIGERLRRDRLYPRGGQKIQAAQIDAQAARRQLRNFLRLHPSAFSPGRPAPSIARERPRRKDALKTEPPACDPECFS